jgi:hypothetical protein
MSPEERFLIGVSMFETARAIAPSSMPAGLPPGELRRSLCERCYPELAAAAYPR